MPETSSSNDTFRNAEADLATAYLVLNNPQGNLFGIACFHIHQAVEKYLKGYVTHKGGQPPLVRDLKILLDRCVVYDDGLSQFDGFCRELNPYYIETRYEPGSPDDFTRDEADDNYRRAEKLVAYIKSSLEIQD